ncbi:hypothetical protein ACHAXT_010062 [Thalassiosira profunda]
MLIHRPICVSLGLLSPRQPLLVGRLLTSPATGRHGHRRQQPGHQRQQRQRTPRRYFANTAVWSSVQDAVTMQGSAYEFAGEGTFTHQLETDAVAKPNCGLLGLTLDELSHELEGSGRAAVVWDCISNGVDPNLYYSGDDGRDSSDDAIADAWLAATSHIGGIDAPSGDWQNEQVIISGRRQGQGLGSAAWKRLQDVMQSNLQSDSDEDKSPDGEEVRTIANSVASLSHINVSPDGTAKLLLKMKRDGLEVESVIIPWLDKGFSTLCVSSQVGCRQGCTFCATGRMGRLRSLSTEEIVVQLFYATKVCRVANSIVHPQIDALPAIDNIVFMGMGEPADNADAVVAAANAMADRRMFGLAQSKVTISTVAPDPTAFVTLGQAPVALAWSVHAVDDALRRSLVPTTKYTMEELKAGLIQALSIRSRKQRRTMLEVALIDGVNDSDEDAELLGAFALSIMDEVAGSKAVVNLIPYNDISHPTYRTPSMERVLAFQKIITDRGVLCYVRTTRGDEESAACGQLATKRKKARGS